MHEVKVIALSPDSIKVLEDECNRFRAEAGKYKGICQGLEEAKLKAQQIISDQSVEILRLNNIVMRCLDDLQSYCAEFEQVFDTVDLPYESMAEYLIRAEYLNGKKLRDCAHYIERVKIKMNALPAY
jgi:hypothetical protein